MGRFKVAIRGLKAMRGEHRKYLPYVFTEHGAIMATTILNSPHAVEVSIYVVRAFVQLQKLLAGILDAIRQLMAPPQVAKRRPIGFVTG